MDIVSNIFTQIFGLYFLGLLFAFAFSVMSYQKDFKYVKLWNGFWLKLLKMIGEALVKLSIPVLRQIGDKIVYVASHHLDKNKPKTPPTITTSVTGGGNVPPPVTPDPTPQQNTTKQSSANPYDDPPEPEIMD